MYKYEFGMKVSFMVAEGMTSIKVNNGFLELDEKPDTATAALIAKCGGQLIDSPVETAKVAPKAPARKDKGA